VLVSASAGGSASLVYLAVFGRDDGHLTRGTATLVGDRVKVLALSIADQRVTLDVVEAGPGDPQCCPSRLARKTYALQGGALVPVTPVATGSLSLADVAGAEWRLVSLDDQSLPPGARPPTLFIDGTRVAGFAGCNRYAGTIEERTSGVVTISSLATTNMSCAAMASDIERRYLAGLTRVSRYAVVAGHLQFIHVEDGTPRPLTFERRAAMSPADQLR
jgi:heat shock protein HslJ